MGRTIHSKLLNSRMHCIIANGNLQYYVAKKIYSTKLENLASTNSIKFHFCFLLWMDTKTGHPHLHLQLALLVCFGWGVLARSRGTVFFFRLLISQLKLCWLVLVMIHPKKCGFSWPKSLTSFGCRISTTDAEFPSKLRQISFETTHCWMTHVSTEVFKTFTRLYLCFLMCFAGQISLLHVQLPVLLPNVLIRNYLKIQFQWYKWI